MSVTYRLRALPLPGRSGDPFHGFSRPLQSVRAPRLGAPVRGRRGREHVQLVQQPVVRHGLHPGPGARQHASIRLRESSGRVLLALHADPHLYLHSQLGSLFYRWDCLPHRAQRSFIRLLCYANPIYWLTWKTHEYKNNTQDNNITSPARAGIYQCTRKP